MLQLNPRYETIFNSNNRYFYLLTDNMFIPNITAEGIAREIVSRTIGKQAAMVNDLYNAIKDFPALQHLVNLLLNHVPGQAITSDELNTAMSELLTFYNRNTDNKSNLTSEQKTTEKMMNHTYVSMVNDTLLSYLVKIS